jgi:hypothetical protein
MSRVRVFQALVVLSVLLHFAWLLLPGGSASPDAQEALRWGGHGGTLALQHPLIYVAFGAVKLVAALGLLFFLAWGRWVLACLLLVSLAQIPFNGIAVGLPHENVVGALTGLVDGAVLALSFASPLSRNLRKDA